MSWLCHLDPLLLEQNTKLVLVFPESGRRWFINDHAGNRYEDYLLDDLIPAIDSTFMTDPRRQSRIIGGFSMGGAAAVYASLRRPAVFGASFSYGGAFYASRREGDPYASFRSDRCAMPTEDEHNRVWGPPGTVVRGLYDPDHLISEVGRQGGAPRILLEVGIDDFPRVVEQNRKMHGSLTAAGIGHHYRESCGDHTWAAAAASAQRMLRILMGPTLSSESERP